MTIEKVSGAVYTAVPAVMPGISVPPPATNTHRNPAGTSSGGLTVKSRSMISPTPNSTVLLPEKLSRAVSRPVTGGGVTGAGAGVGAGARAGGGGEGGVTPGAGAGVGGTCELAVSLTAGLESRSNSLPTAGM
ncbi:MAG TPA: hypothetical protein VGE04_19960 [Chloroflexia bacterium]